MPHHSSRAKHGQTPVIRSKALWAAFCGLAIAGIASLAVWYYNPAMPALPAPPLKDLAGAKGVELGMLAQPRDLKNDVFRRIMTSQYSKLTSDGQLHWDTFRPSATTYNFSGMDELVAYASNNAMTVEGHHLVWGEPDSLPRWLKRGDYSKQQLRDIMREHIAAVAGHYKGRVKAWTVVNEPFSRAQHVFGLRDWWADQLGGDSYIDDAFRWARQADPRATLILNDFYNETDSSVSNAMYDYVKSAKARGVPIDGVGIQMHVDAAYPRSKAAIIKNIQRFAALGTPVYITEFDVNSSRVKGDIDKQQLESQIAAEVVRACVESGGCVSLTVFGMTDPTGLARLTAYNKDRSYMFTGRYTPKPEFYGFRSAWLQP